MEVVQGKIGFNLCIAPSMHVSSLFGRRGNLGEQRLSRKTEVDIQTGLQTEVLGLKYTIDVSEGTKGG